MDDYFTKIVERTLHLHDVVHPRLPSRFETNTGNHGMVDSAPFSEYGPNANMEHVMPDNGGDVFTMRKKSMPDQDESAIIPSRQPQTDKEQRGPSIKIIELLTQSKTHKAIHVNGSQPSLVNPGNEGVTAAAKPQSTKVITTEKTLPDLSMDGDRGALREAVKSILAMMSGSSQSRDRLSGDAYNVPESSPGPHDTVQIRIGRIEVKAMTTPEIPKRKNIVKPAPALSLAEYLKKRSESNG